MQFESFRQLTRKSPAIAGGAAVVVILAVGISVYLRYVAAGTVNDGPAKAYFLDEDAWDPANPEVRASSDLPPLLGAKGAPTVVRAYYYTYGADDQKQLAYVAKFDSTAQEVLAKPAAERTPEDFEALAQARQVRAPKPGSPWVKELSQPGQDVINASVDPNADPRKLRVVSPQ